MVEIGQSLGGGVMGRLEALEMYMDKRMQDVPVQGSSCLRQCRHALKMFGLALLVITFFVYISGVLPTFVPIDDLPKYWTMRVHDFNHELHAPTGWGWTAFVGKGDYLNFIPIAILAGLTILCYLVILPIFAVPRR